MFTTLAEISGNVEILGKGLMMGLGMIGPGIGIGLVGNAFINAVGRNPEAAKFLGQALVLIGIIELLALLVFASLFII